MMLNTWMTVAGLVMAVAWSACGQTLQFLGTKVEGDGAIQLRWQSETNAIYRIEYKTSLSTSAVWQTLVAEFVSHGTNTTFLDTGRYWEDPELKHPIFDSQRYYRVAGTGTNKLAPPVVTVSAPSPGSVLNGEVTITATAVSTNNIASIKFFVDGEELEEVSIPDAGTASYTINTTEWPNGPHNVFAVALTTTGTETTGTPSTVQNGAGASAYIPVTFDNYISKWFFSEPIFEPSLGETQRITATFAAYSTWTLDILDSFNTAVRTAFGEGYTMQFDWDGNGNGGASLPDGEYGFTLTATETAPPAPPPGGGGGGGPPSPMMAAMAVGQTSYFVEAPPMPPVKKDGKWYSWEEIYGPIPPIEVKIPETSIQRFLASSLGVDNGSGAMLNGGGGGGGGGATQAPRRPPPKRLKGKPGVVGVAYQGHHPFTTNGIPGFTRPNNIVGLITLDPNFVLPYGPIVRARAIADGFPGAMSKSGWKTAFNYGDDRITAPLLRKPSKGGSNLFNFCNIGLLIGHGIRGTTQDGVATSTPSLQTYMPIYKSGVNAYDWVRMSEFSFGGGPAGLRWIGIYACNMFSYANLSDMWNKGVLPLNTTGHIVLASETSVQMYPSFGQKWSSYMNGGEGGGRRTVLDGWILASQKVHAVVNPSHSVTMTSVYWPVCRNDKLLEYTPNDSDDPSEILFRRVQVHPTYVDIE